MSPSKHAVLVEVVDTTRESDEPVTTHELADSLDIPESTVSDRIDSLSKTTATRSTKTD